MTDTIRVATTKISALELIKLQEAELDNLRGENRQLQEKVQGLEAKAQELEETAKELEAKVQGLEEEVKELQRSQAKNSSNSSKPPSTNGYKKPEKLRSRRTKSGRKPGGQPGHRGHNLSRKENPDFIVIHTPDQCKQCGESLKGTEGRCVETRQVFDIPEPKIEVTEHQVEEKTCSCGAVCRGDFPLGVHAATQYGPRICALGAYFSNQQHIPVERLRAVFADVFGVSLSGGTLDAINSKLYNMLEPFEEAVKNYLLQEKVVHFDETGVACVTDPTEKVSTSSISSEASSEIEGSKLHWIHSASSVTATFFMIHPKRGQDAMNHMEILPKFTQIAVHDHWKPYLIYMQCEHGSCNSHHDRELEFIAVQEKEDWAKQMQTLLYTIKALVEEHRNRGENCLPAATLQEVEQEYQRIISQGMNYHLELPDLSKNKRGRQKQRPGKNLLDRLQQYQKNVLLFAHNFEVPFTNNLAERDIRMAKLKQKISGCFRSLHGGQRFCRIRSYISTARKQGWNVLQAIIDAVKGTPRSPVPT